MYDAKVRAERARAILDDPLVIEALDAIEAAAIENLAHANLADNDALRMHVAKLQAARDLRAHFKSLIVSGTPISPRFGVA